MQLSQRLTLCHPMIYLMLITMACDKNELHVISSHFHRSVDRRVQPIAFEKDFVAVTAVKRMFADAENKYHPVKLITLLLDLILRPI